MMNMFRCIAAWLRDAIYRVTGLDIVRRLADDCAHLSLENMELSAELADFHRRYEQWLEVRDLYGERVKLADAVAEWLVHGPLGENPKQMGVHPFKRWDIQPIPEEGEEYRAGLRHRGERAATDSDEGSLSGDPRSGETVELQVPRREALLAAGRHHRGWA